MNAPAAVGTVAGAFAFSPQYPGNPSRFPWATMTAGASALRAGVGGAGVGLFGFAHADGKVTNVQTDAATDRVGVVTFPFASPALNTWQRNYWDATTRTYRIREGTEVVALTRGAVWVRFEGGAWPGQRVYANVLNGQPQAGYAVDAVLTRWVVQTAAAPGELAIINTTSFFAEG